jgi:hypothetical protein
MAAATSCQEGQVEEWEVQEVKIGPSRCVLFTFVFHFTPMCSAPSVDDYAAAHVIVVHVAADCSHPSLPCVLALEPHHESSTSMHYHRSRKQ